MKLISIKTIMATCFTFFVLFYPFLSPSEGDRLISVLREELHDEMFGELKRYFPKSGAKPVDNAAGNLMKGSLKRGGKFYHTHNDWKEYLEELYTCAGVLAGYVYNTIKTSTGSLIKALSGEVYLTCQCTGETFKIKGGAADKLRLLLKVDQCEMKCWKNTRYYFGYNREQISEALADYQRAYKEALVFNKDRVSSLVNYNAMYSSVTSNMNYRKDELNNYSNYKYNPEENIKKRMEKFYGNQLDQYKYNSKESDNFVRQENMFNEYAYYQELAEIFSEYNLDSINPNILNLPNGITPISDYEFYSKDIEELWKRLDKTERTEVNTKLNSHGVSIFQGGRVRIDKNKIK